jgi:hypothetical protein
MSQSPAEVLPIPPAATAAEERANVLALIFRRAREFCHAESRGERPVFPAKAADDLGNEIAAGEHNRELVDPRPRPRDFRAVLDRLAEDWQAAFDATPEATRGVESAAGLATVVAGNYVAGLDDAGLSKLHAAMGFPPEWSRIHAAANLVSYLMSVFGHWLRQRQGAGDDTQRI